MSPQKRPWEVRSAWCRTAIRSRSTSTNAASSCRSTKPNWLRRGEAEGRPGPAPPDRGYRRLYALHVTQANLGCDFDFLSAAHASATPPAADRSERSLEVR